MGGSLGVTIRDIEGKEHRMCRWTNPTPSFINSVGFIEKDQTHLDEYLKVWYDMVESYKTGAYKKEKFTMVDSYAPNPYLAPMGYGLLLIDYTTSTILHMQGYANYGEDSATGIGLALLSDGAEREIQRYKDLFEKKKMRSLFDYDFDAWDRGEKDENGEVKKIRFSPKSWEELLNMCKGKKRTHMNIELDMSPWKIKRFDSSEAENFLKEVEELGFSLDEQERSLWKEWVEYHNE